MADRRSLDVSERDPQSGFSLVELLVAMAIFTVFLVIVLTSVASISRSEVRTQLVGQSTNSTLVFFGIMDRQVRYSDSINYPGVGASGDKYVEFRVPAASTAGGLVAICYQWRFSVTNLRLESRQWNEGNSASATAWSVKLTDMANDGVATHPFQLVPANITDTPRQQLLLSLNSGADAQNAGASMSTTFIARNTSIKSRSNDPLTPVCTFGGYRS
ncbi:type II secretion system protein J [Lacisediminihabitans sp. H27-G8]|uniref:type II secretion system protein J n=1 Tax=Lacisediminihabitans sp. H27-G8 TaxID=3111909 RepID=UPI0038FBFBFE